MEDKYRNFELELQRIITNYADKIWFNNTELNYNVDMGIEFEEAIWKWINENFILKQSILTLVDNVIKEKQKIREKYLGLDSDKWAKAIQEQEALTELKGKIEAL